MTCIPVDDYREALDHPQMQHREQLTSRDHPEDGKVWVMRPPLMGPAIESAITRPPDLGEHSAEVLSDWLGWTDNNIGALAASDKKYWRMWDG